MIGYAVALVFVLGAVLAGAEILHQVALALARALGA